jgi:hypothetical protein
MSFLQGQTHDTLLERQHWECAVVDEPSAVCSMLQAPHRSLFSLFLGYHSILLGDLEVMSDNVRIPSRTMVSTAMLGLKIRHLCHQVRIQIIYAARQANCDTMYVEAILGFIS